MIRRDASRQAEREGKGRTRREAFECGENEAKVIDPPLWADRAARGTSIRGMERSIVARTVSFALAPS